MFHFEDLQYVKTCTLISYDYEISLCILLWAKAFPSIRVEAPSISLMHVAFWEDQ